MNLPLALKIIQEAETRGSERYRVRGRLEAREVQQMAEAGLVRASNIDPIDPSEAVITSVTHAGRQFCRALQNAPRKYAHA